MMMKVCAWYRACLFASPATLEYISLVTSSALLLCTAFSFVWFSFRFYFAVLFFFPADNERLCFFFFRLCVQHVTIEQQGGATISVHAAPCQQRRGWRAQASCQEARGYRGGPPSRE